MPPTKVDIKLKIVENTATFFLFYILAITKELGRLGRQGHS